MRLLEALEVEQPQAWAPAALGAPPWALPPSAFLFSLEVERRAQRAEARRGLPPAAASARSKECAPPASQDAAAARPAIPVNLPAPTAHSGTRGRAGNERWRRQ